MPIVAMAVLVASISTSSAGQLRVAVDLSALEADELGGVEAARVYNALVLRLLAGGDALVDAAETADLVVRLRTSNAGELAVSVMTTDGAKHASLALGDEEPTQLELHIVHAAMTLVRSAREERTRAMAAADARASDRGDVLSLGAQASVGVLRSGSHEGVLGSVEGRVDLGPGQLLGGVLGHAPAALSPELRAREWGAYLGARREQAALAAWLTWSAALGAGVVQQRIEYHGAAGDTAHNERFDVLARLTLGVHAAVGAAWRLGVEAGVLGTLHDRLHRTGTSVLWHAPHVRPLVSLALEYGGGGKF